MKKFFAKEFLWLILTIVLAIPLGFVFLHFLELSPQGQQYNYEEEVFLVQLYLIGVLLSFAGIYIIRIMISALKILTGA
jgi:hypothetical protein